MDFRKCLSLAAAVIMSCSVFSVTAAAENTYCTGSTAISEAYAADPVYSEAKKLANAEYRSSFVKAIKKCRKADKKDISFGSSCTSNFLDSLEKAKDSNEIGFSMVGSNLILDIAVKNDKSKIILYSDKNANAVYTDSRKTTALEMRSKVKAAIPNKNAGSHDDVFALIPFSKKDFPSENSGKTFKFKINKKSYIYEEFKNNNGSRWGFLFDKSGNIMALTSDFGSYCCSFSESVDSSEFKIPDSYKSV